jgi:hypothetical protein
MNKRGNIGRVITTAPNRNRVMKEGISHFVKWISNNNTKEHDNKEGEITTQKANLLDQCEELSTEEINLALNRYTKHTKGDVTNIHYEEHTKSKRRGQQDKKRIQIVTREEKTNSILDDINKEETLIPPQTRTKQKENNHAVSEIVVAKDSNKNIKPRIDKVHTEGRKDNNLNEERCSKCDEYYTEDGCSAQYCRHFETKKRSTGHKDMAIMPMDQRNKRGKQPIKANRVPISGQNNNCLFRAFREALPQQHHMKYKSAQQIRYMTETFIKKNSNRTVSYRHGGNNTKTIFQANNTKRLQN